jgi:hypothetical protein
MVAREQAKEACHLSRRDERRREELDEVGVHVQSLCCMNFLPQQQGMSK